MRTEQFTRPARLLRVREQGDPAERRPEGKKAPGGKSRFVAPSYFSAERQEAMARLLQTAKVGDAEGRQLFLTAMEYELGSFQFNPAEEPAPKPVPRAKTPLDTDLEALGAAALGLAGLLERLPPGVREELGQDLSASDPLGRRYEERFFAHLGVELGRLAAASARRVGSGEPAPPPLSPQARRLVLQLARIYQECLEVRLTVETAGPFMEILGFVREAADLDIPCESGIVVGLVSASP